MPSNQTQKIWENGISLNVAWLELASMEDRRNYDESPPILSAFGSATDLPTLIDSTLALSGVMRRELDLTERLKGDLLDSLFNDQYVATGFRSPPNGRARAVIVEPNLFDGDPDISWEDDKISNFGALFVMVRISRRISIGVQEVARQGRPGANRAINSAIGELIKSVPCFCDQNKKMSCQQIRQYLDVPETNQNGLSLANLSRYIRLNCPKKPIQ